MTRQDWLLLVLAAAGGKPLSPLQLQKSLFLVGYDLAKLVGADFYTFRPFDYGPFDATVYQDAEEQAAQGLVTIRSHPVTKREFSLTHDGGNPGAGVGAGAARRRGAPLSLCRAVGTESDFPRN